MKKLFLFILVVLQVMTLSACRNKTKAETLANWGKEQFLANDYENYIGVLREAGFSDLNADVDISYDYREDYNSQTKTLEINCIVSLTSEEIDNYYTTEMDGDIAYRLARAMRQLYKAKPIKKYTFVSPEKETVIANILLSDTITTPNGREYYYFNSGDYIFISIDHDLVFSSDLCKECGEFEWDSYRNPFSGELEFYCYEHYSEIMDMLGSMGIG